MNDHSSIIHNRQKVETTQVPLVASGGVKCSLSIQQYKEMEYCCNLDEHRKPYAKQKKLDTKDHILNDSVFMKCPEKVTLWKQKAN